MSDEVLTPQEARLCLQGLDVIQKTADLTLEQRRDVLYVQFKLRAVMNEKAGSPPQPAKAVEAPEPKKGKREEVT